MLNLFDKTLQKSPLFSDTAVKLLQDEKSPDDFTYITATATSTVLFTYIWWVLLSAQRQGIKQLYFLSRDGYVMKIIADKITQKLNLEITCHYLYCSRYSLRMAAYKFHGDEAYDLLFLKAAKLTAKNTLSRVNMSEPLRKAVYDDIGFDIANETKQMSNNEFAAFCNSLKQSKEFNDIVTEKSQQAYDITMAYFKQENLTEQHHIGIVDTGWTGSMQYTLSKLFSCAHINTKITGYYFGLYNRQKPNEKSVYNAWYFSPQKSTALSVKFNNNLMECICSAPHGMTTGYCEENNVISPVFAASAATEKNAEIVAEQIRIIEKFALLTAEKMTLDEFESFDKKQLHSLSQKLLVKLMFRPQMEVANAFSKFYFCDDVSEIYCKPLVETARQQQFKPTLLHNKLLALVKKSDKTSDFFYWSQGTLAVSNIKHKALYRLSISTWDKLRFLALRRK